MDQNGKRSGVGGRGAGNGGGGHSKDMSASAAVATPADGTRQKKGWLQKARK